MKAADIRNLSVEDLKAKIAEEEANYDQLKLTNAVSPIANPIGIKQLRRTIARLITVLNEKKS
ncbi:50S ribosomal protein L29 [Algoriella sp.]|uniref:50S ribosomal protein L29 n=1 Tax=Algoriella sp. TaxID=1872434 RepID=UPI002FC80F86